MKNFLFCFRWLLQYYCWEMHNASKYDHSIIILYGKNCKPNLYQNARINSRPKYQLHYFFQCRLMSSQDPINCLSLLDSDRYTPEYWMCRYLKTFADENVKCSFSNNWKFCRWKCYFVFGSLDMKKIILEISSGVCDSQYSKFWKRQNDLQHY